MEEKREERGQLQQQTEVRREPADRSRREQEAQPADRSRREQEAQPADRGRREQEARREQADRSRREQEVRREQQARRAQRERQARREERRAAWNIRPYLAVGLTAFIVIFLSMVAFFLIYRYHGLLDNWKLLVGILQPIIIGFVLAYLINPIVKWEEKYLLKWFLKRARREQKARKAARALSVAGALIFVGLILVVLLNMVIPELYTSIERMVVQLPSQVERFIAWLEGYVSSDSQISAYLEQALNRSISIFEDWARTDFLPQTRNLLTSLTTGVLSVVRVLLNILIGVIVSVYLLMSKETFVGQAKKVVYAILPAKQGNVLVEVARKSNRIFSGFISGKILDSAIIGVLCFIGLYLLRMPYVVLVSVIVGVTNVIPFFGPYIGAIPSTILIMLTSPIQGLYFLIFIIILQQLDGNVIGPKILGDSTGLSSFWVLFSILIGGGLFGFMGMVLGVPVFATLYYLVQKLTAYILRKKGLPQETADYTELTRVDPATNRPDYTKIPEPEKRQKKKG